MGGLLQWCCFVILFREFIAMDSVREGFWWTFSKILRYVKGSGNIFHIYLFEILYHLWVFLWWVSSNYRHGKWKEKIGAMGNVAMWNVVIKNVAIEMSPWKKIVSTSGVKKISKGWNENLIFDFAWGGCCKNLYKCKISYVLLFVFFLSSYNVIRDFPPLSWSVSWYLCVFCIAHIIMTRHWGVVNNEMLLVALLASFRNPSRS
jgi:hypothetical protein